MLKVEKTPLVSHLTERFDPRAVTQFKGIKFAPCIDWFVISWGISAELHRPEGKGFLIKTVSQEE